MQIQAKKKMLNKISYTEHRERKKEARILFNNYCFNTQNVDVTFSIDELYLLFHYIKVFFIIMHDDVMMCHHLF